MILHHLIIIFFKNIYTATSKLATSRLYFNTWTCFEQARFLLAKLNPSASYSNVHEMAAGSDVIFTDDVSLQVFIDHLQQLAVQAS